MTVVVIRIVSCCEVVTLLLGNIFSRMFSLRAKLALEGGNKMECDESVTTWRPSTTDGTVVHGNPRHGKALAPSPAARMPQRRTRVGESGALRRSMMPAGSSKTGVRSGANRTKMLDTLPQMR